MLTIRKSEERGHLNHGWLDTYHTFSFGGYRDPKHVHFRALRVINDDIVAPGMGFDMHPHRDMEIITYVVSGTLQHRDSLGNVGTLTAGDFQVMTAGTGITHAEFNASADEELRIIQTWIIPAERGLTPQYADLHAADYASDDRVRVIASSRDEGALPIHQDARVLHVKLAANETESIELGPGRAAWLQVVDGGVTVGDAELQRGDGLAIEDEAVVTITATADADLLIFDLAA